MLLIGWDHHVMLGFGSDEAGLLGSILTLCDVVAYGGALDRCWLLVVRLLSHSHFTPHFVGAPAASTHSAFRSHAWLYAAAEPQ